MATIEEQKKIVKTYCTKYKSLPLLPLSKKQRLTSHNAPAKGDIWISRVNFFAPSDTGLRDFLYRITNLLKASDHEITPPEEVTLEVVDVEFVGRRRGGDRNAPEPRIPEQEKLKALEAECENDMTILYIHGGGFYFGSAVEFRAATTRLARLTKARVAAIRYRLAPVNTFPGQLLDTLVAYASLVYPPPGSYHKAVPAQRIVLAGNSAGANLCLALTKILLEQQRYVNQSVLFNGRMVRLPLPAGIATCSAWIDQCGSLPSWRINGEFDLFNVTHPVLQPDQPSDDIWPSNPPREHPYCAAVTLDHELVSPTAISDWTGAPPMWIACGGEERCLDANKALAGQAAKCGVIVSWNEYQGMPHEFPLLLSMLPQAKHCFDSWAMIILISVSGCSAANTFSLLFITCVFNCSASIHCP